MAASSSASTATPAGMSEAAAPHKPDRSRMKKSAAPAPPRSVAGGSSSACSFSGPTTSRSSAAACLQQPLPPATGGNAVNRSVSNDDCAIDDLLEGRMDLRLVLPDGREVLVNVERRTPVMDLLVQVATAHKINPSGHLIQVPAGDRGDPLTCKPNTAIGSLDTGRLLVVPKATLGVAATDAPLLRHVSQHAGNRISKLQPFESTLRVQVRLPRNQLMVLRLPLGTTLDEVRRTACLEKNLDPVGYQLVRPGIPTQPLDLHCSLLEYGASEVMLLSNRTLAENIQNSTADLRSYSMNQEGKRIVLGLPSHSRSKGSLTGSSSDGTTSSRGASPCRSEPPTAISSRAAPVKKRPAPPPPMPASPPPNTEARSAGVLLVSESMPLVAAGKVSGKREGGPTHSRQSSDSSGYHEASVLSDLPDTPSPEAALGRPPSNAAARRDSPPRNVGLSSSTSNLASAGTTTRAARARSVVLEGAAIGQGRKRKAPPPPPLALASSTQSKKDDIQAGDSRPREGPASERMKDAAGSPERREKGETMSSWGSAVPPPPHFSGAISPSSSTDTASTNRMSSPEPGPLTPSSWLHKQDDKADACPPSSHINTLSSTAEDAYSMAEHSTGVSESLSWEYAIPEPPSPFRTRVPCELDSHQVEEGKVTVTDSPVSPLPLQAVARDTLSSDDLEDDGSLVDSGLVENFHEDLNEPEADIQGAVSHLQHKPCHTSSPVHAAGVSVELAPSVTEQVPTEETTVSSGSNDQSAKESSKHVQSVDSEKPSSATPILSSVTTVVTEKVSSDSACKRDMKVTVTQAEEKQELPKKVPEQVEQSLQKAADVTVTIKTSVPKEADTEAEASPALLDSVQAQNITILSQSSSETPVPRRESSSKEVEPSPDIDAAPLTASVIRKDLVRLSSFPSATETKIERLEHVPATDTPSLRSESRSEASILDPEPHESVRRGNEPVVRSRSINYGPVAFSIGSYGSYKTEAVDDIFSGDPTQTRFERFKNIKVAGSTKATTAEVHPSVVSKTVPAPITATVTKVTAKNGKDNKDDSASFTVKIGEKKRSGDGGEADQTRKQSMSVIDLRQVQAAVRTETSREGADSQFVEEKENLLTEYAKLQQQFVAWQQQLASNQNLLEDKKIVPSVATTTVSAPVPSKAFTASDGSTANGPHDVRTFTLPRTKPVRPQTHVFQEHGRTVSRQFSVDTPVVSFGSWGERKEDQQQHGGAPSGNNSNKSLNVWKNSGVGVTQSGSTSAQPFSVKQDSKDSRTRVPKKPAGILYAAPVVRGFSQEAIEKLSQEVCLTERPEPRQAMCPRRNSESANLVAAMATRRSTSQENLAAPAIPPKSSSRPLSVHVGSMRDLEHTTSTLERVSAWDRRSSQSDIVVRLAKKPSGTSSSTSSLPSADPPGNNKPSVVQATLKSGVVTTTTTTAQPPLPPPFPSAKVNGHAQVNSSEVDGHPKGVNRNFKGRETKVQPEKVAHATAKPVVAPKVQTAPRKVQVATVDPRDVLMDEIRNFGGKRALKKVSTEPAWQLNICNLRSA